jgi:hypothetical protein
VAALAAQHASSAAQLLAAFPTAVESAYAGTIASTSFLVAGVAPVLDVGVATTNTRASRAPDTPPTPSAEHQLPAPQPVGGGGGSGGGAAAGGGGSSSPPAASVLVAAPLQTAPGIVRLVTLSEQSWRTSFAVLIPERPD